MTFSRKNIPLQTLDDNMKPVSGCGFNPLDYPLALELPKRASALAWHEHIPFAKLLVQLLRPKTLVELGVHKGDSYLAFCEAASGLGLETACFGVDTWQGDEHAGHYDTAVLDDLRAYHDPLYGRFSRLVQSTFDAAAGSFADGSIELLHIDGLHTYDAVRHDWETWKLKVSPNGVVLFHDTNVRERDFGVWRLWEELRNTQRHFEFLHGHGLGVLTMGSGIPEALNAFLTAAERHPERIRNYFFTLGNRITLQAAVRAEGAKVLDYEAQSRGRGEELAKLDRAFQARGEEIARLEQQVSLRATEIERLKARIDETEKSLSRHMADVASLREHYANLRAETDALREERARIMAGASFKIGRVLTAPVRVLLGKP